MAIEIDQSHYNTGTATVAANGTAVTGQGTTWQGSVRKGDLFGTHKGSGIRIASVNSNTSLTLAYPWLGGAQTAAAYEIQRTPFDVGYLKAIEDMIKLYGMGTLPALAGLDGTGGNKGIVLTSPSSADTFDLDDLATKADLDGFATKAGAETLSNKSFDTSVQVFMDGGRMGVTASATPMAFVDAVLHVRNEDVVSCGFKVTSLWTGSATAPYQNNDTALFEVFNTTTNTSLNRSWAGSFANAYHRIPAGVFDSGTRVGVIGWATSVNAVGYKHEGRLATQFGVHGTAGFQGDGSGTSAVIDLAVGVNGQIYSDSTGGARIKDARAGSFTSVYQGSVLEKNYGVFAAAIGGVENWSFFGAAGKMYQEEEANFASAIKQAGVALKALRGIEIAQVTTQYQTTGNVYVPTEGVNYAAKSQTSSLLVLCAAQLEMERADVGVLNMNARLHRYTGTAFSPLANSQAVQFVHSSVAAGVIMRTGVTMIGTLSAAQKRTDTPGTWNINPHILANNGTAKMRFFDMLLVEFEP